MRAGHFVQQSNGDIAFEAAPLARAHPIGWARTSPAACTNNGVHPGSVYGATPERGERGEPQYTTGAAQPGQEVRPRSSITFVVALAPLGMFG